MGVEAPPSTHAMSDSAAAEGAKRSAEDLPAGVPAAKVAKVGESSPVKDEIKDELKAEVKTEAQKDEPKEKKEKKEKKEGKEHKEGKEKKEKHKDKEKKEKKEKTHGDREKENEVRPFPSPELDKELDQRKLFKDGQRFLTPPVADATRAFYESLHAENSESKIAIRFCVEYGLFPSEQHKGILKRYNRLKDKGAFDARILLMKNLNKQHNKEGKEHKEKKDKSDKKEKKEKKEKSEKEEPSVSPRES